MPKEYIEREALKEDLKESYNRLRAIYDGLTHDEDKQICAGQLTTFTEAILRVKDAPAADVVEVVRCKDCEYWKRYGGQYADDGECWHLGELDCCMHKDDYCSKGRRKMDKEE